MYSNLIQKGQGNDMKVNDMKVIDITTEQQFAEASRIRKLVFVEEQGVPEENEFDEYDVDPATTHILALHEDQPAGTARLRVVDDAAKLERICVLAAYRKYGVGRVLMAKLEELARDAGHRKLKLNAQVHAEPFYEKLGFRTVSDVFLEENIPHVTMVKQLP